MAFSAFFWIGLVTIGARRAVMDELTAPADRPDHGRRVGGERSRPAAPATLRRAFEAGKRLGESGRRVLRAHDFGR